MKKEFEIDEMGSLGLLALGDVGLKAWREKRGVLPPGKGENSEGKRVIVVSGHPRSGTSLMMQILAKAGIPLFIDEIRERDENNPEGYFEHEKIKNLSKDNHFFRQASGKAAKVVTPLVPYLPLDLDYRFIRMERDLDEILLSQQKMIGTHNAEENKLKQIYSDQTKRAEQFINGLSSKYLVIEHQSLIRCPEREIEKVLAFLDIDVQKKEDLLTVVKTDLYRNRK